jgi:hypothetical protein
VRSGPRGIASQFASALAMLGKAANKIETTLAVQRFMPLPTPRSQACTQMHFMTIQRNHAVLKSYPALVAFSPLRRIMATG